MIGAILSGGYGKRLKPITDEIPKVLVEIKPNYTIMDRQILDFKYLGIEDIYVLSGHLGEKIEDRYGKVHDGIRFHYLKEEKPMGTLYSIRNLLETVGDEDVMLRNGDTITDINFEHFRKFSKESAFGMTMLVTRMRSPYGIVEMNGDQVTSFREKPVLEHYINSGLYYIKSSIREIFFNEYNGKDVEITVFPEIAKRRLLGAYKEDSLWIGVDSEKELEQARSEYKGREDTSFGYKKDIFENDRLGITEYLVKDDYSATITPEDGNLLRILSGSGIINGSLKESYTHGTVIKIENPVTVKAQQTTRLEVFSN
ncbi:nucleotidyltransferase family protein [Cuniculiplasma divulgatum]|jgi:NDP-sugar pyrophosphorylase family protein|uniref:Sugar phosphate nucleotydyl transferase n=1 Tax=Cuniculiplasma divulgatum TaxID=1673428 RepID=A0A1N5SQ77_9ARCH|nr:nucleotidyltransferase family protein [Cuniculiplasma divulgatum]MCI2412439.1 nucleotidyltransferase family protein [Cuniculiplasma sp.]MCL4320705.1 nucleotidyltransferase family protein [Candidatus Thermoplasmatota archaeon]MCL6014042.1 nucleotidyltransferase family protein [Candidatus Thermoplasmatota archaeon]SIM38293.1 sugar phosphate nucleotydyl transferase [Cuniculiplasma divulgatum]